MRLGKQQADGMSYYYGWIDPETRSYVETGDAAVRPGRHRPDTACETEPADHAADAEQLALVDPPEADSTSDEEPEADTGHVVTTLDTRSAATSGTTTFDHGRMVDFAFRASPGEVRPPSARHNQYAGSFRSASVGCAGLVAGPAPTRRTTQTTRHLRDRITIHPHRRD